MNSNSFSHLVNENISEATLNNIVYKAFPDKRPRPVPSTDELIYLFLLSHDVEVVPVDADVRSSSVLEGLIGGYTGEWDAVFTASQMRQDRKIAARAEWISWKQWALSHADWQSFKSTKTQEAESFNLAVREWREDPATQSLIEKAVKDWKEANLKETSEVIQLVVIGLLVTAGIAAFLVITDLMGKKGGDPLPVPPQNSSQIN